jgi:ADP-heptose:LPS heptosyltransferase
MTRIIKPTIFDKEEKFEKIGLNIFNFSKRERPKDPEKIMYVFCFSEFGCESLGLMYVIPKMKKEYPDSYMIAIGWYGREYLYRHLVDEFWEVKKEHQKLREYSKAFHHTSRNLMKLELSFRGKGVVCPSAYLGQYVVGARCLKCGKFYEKEKNAECPQCKSTEFDPSIFGNMAEAKRNVVRIPNPSKEVLDKANEYIDDNTVGVFARGRKRYGRNLSPEFYKELISLLEKRGYNIIWLGEEASTQACPCDHILDFSRLPESRNLELTLAILSKLKFTIQYWTASTRFASMMGTPYLLFESPDQIYGNGQEGYRRWLCDFSPNKLVIAHFRDMFENKTRCLELTNKAIEEIEFYNFNDLYDKGCLPRTNG